MPPADEGEEARVGQGSGAEPMPHAPDDPRRAYKLIVAYDGGAFSGWQRQSAARTVQATLEDALVDLIGDPAIRLLASSRTDTGVHALGQCCTFRTRAWRAEASRLTMALNTQLPPDVVVRSAAEVPIAFNPITYAQGKRYRYRIYASRISDPHSRRHAWWVKRRLNIEAMQAAAETLLGQHDFASFQTAGSPRVSTVRTVRAIDIRAEDHQDGQSVTIEIEANGFLYNMVRSIVGTLVLVGRQQRPATWVSQVLSSRDRRQAGQTAPAHGLCLLQVFFPSAVE